MVRQPRWASWLAVGAPLGGLVIGSLAATLSAIDSIVEGSGWSLGLWIAPWAGLIAGVWGAVCGLATGLVCAFIIRTLDKRGDRPDGRLDAAVGATVTGLLATPIGLLLLTSAGPFGLWDVAALVLIPVGVSSIVAAAAGAWIWGHTRPAQPVASL